MVIHMNIDALPSFTNGVVTFGSFDGVHLGHGELLNKMRSLAQEVEGETIVVTFDPHPRQVIYPSDRSLQLLSSRREKILLLREMGIDHLVICPFSVEFSQISADEYITNFVIKKFRPRYVVIGYDHRFGLNRAGNIDFLRAYEEQGNFRVVELEQQVVDKINISSTQIRNRLEKGQIATANKLLGHPYLISGTVVRGHQIGEKMGYPTANIRIDNHLKLIPPKGIYAVQVKYDRRLYEGMLYIGTRPTLSSSGRQSIEVHIFNFTGDIYGELVHIFLHKFIRPDATFSGLEELKLQLKKDQEAVESYFRSKKKHNESVAVVILNYNGLHHLKSFLPSVLRFTSASVVVADNGSTDNSVKWLKKFHPEVETLALEKNYGFAGGYNEALRKVDAKYIVFLNSDVEVTNHWLEPLIRYLKENGEVGVVQPKVKSFLTRSSFEYAGAAGGLLDVLGYPFCQGRILSEMEEDLGQYDQIAETFWCTGAAMLTRKELFQDFGGFDEDFFAHMEEIDFCWRLKQAGYKMVMVPDSVVYHLGGGTLSYMSPKKTYLNFRNGLNLLIKNEKGLRLLWLLPIRILLDLVACLRFLLVGEFGNAWSVISAYLSVSKQFFNTLTKRKQILKLIEAKRIGPDNTEAGRYRGSIIWEFFILGRKKYADLRKIASNRIS